jgi:SAM-dependent methyltransferase
VPWLRRLFGVASGRAAGEEEERGGLLDLRSAVSPPAADGSRFLLQRRRRLAAKHPQPKGDRAQKKTKRGAPAFIDALERYFPVRNPVSSRVLDYGCGSGVWLNSFQDLGWETFGIVIVYHVLEHLPRPLDVLKQPSGALAPGGFCLVGVPRLDTLPEYRDHSYCLNPRNHIVAFTEACLRGLLARAGLATVAAFHELDDAMSKGRPTRLRLLAQKKETDGLAPDPAVAMRALIARLPLLGDAQPDDRSPLN